MISSLSLPASIDIGSHSSLLLIAGWEEHEGKRRLEAKVQKIEVVRLGEGLNGQGLIGPERLLELRNALIRFRQTVHALGAEIHSVVLTEAVRKAQNQQEVLALVEEVLWTPPRVLSGDEEAFLSWAAVAHWHGNDQVTIDVGGGSSELSQGSDFLSIPVGALRLKSQFGVIPGPEYKKWAKETLAEYEWKPFAKKRVTLVGGTATALAMLHLELPKFDVKPIEGLELTLEDLERSISRVSNISKELRPQLPGLEKDRSEVIICGLFWIRTLLEKLKVDHFQISTLGLRFGVLLDEDIVAELRPPTKKTRNTRANVEAHS